MSFVLDLICPLPSLFRACISRRAAPRHISPKSAYRVSRPYHARMGILHSLLRMPCRPPASSPPASSTSTTSRSTTHGPLARDKGRASPTKADISHPYPLAPHSGSRASTESAPSPSSRFRARSSRLPYSPLTTDSPLPSGSHRRGQPARVSTMPDTPDSRDRSGVVSAPSSPVPGRIGLPSSHGGHITFDGQPHPRSLTSSPAPYSPPESITSLVPHPRPPAGPRRPGLIDDVLGPSEIGKARQKLRKIMRVEGDWEMVREGDCAGSETNGRPGQAERGLL